MRAIVVATLLATPSSAFALDQREHRTITVEACTSAGLPEDFCDRLGVEAYNVDRYEWSVPAAHAQMAAPGQACLGANATLDRVRALGADIHGSLDQLAFRPSQDVATHVATQLGRALHTIQDGCAHHGMPNPQHAWASLTDACTGSTTSPDLASEAISCARTETAAVVDAFVAQMHAAGVAPNALDGAASGWTHWPNRGDVCAFLEQARTWNGADQRWDNSIVVPRLRDQLTHAIATDASSIGDACAAGSIETQFPAPQVDVSVKPTWCFKLDAYCVGKADGPDEPPPWDDGTAGDASSGGCAVGSSSSSLVIALAVLALRRRRYGR